MKTHLSDIKVGNFYIETQEPNKWRLFLALRKNKETMDGVMWTKTRAGDSFQIGAFKWKLADDYQIGSDVCEAFQPMKDAFWKMISKDVPRLVISLFERPL